MTDNYLHAQGLIRMDICLRCGVALAESSLPDGEVYNGKVTHDRWHRTIDISNWLLLLLIIIAVIVMLIFTR